MLSAFDYVIYSWTQKVANKTEQDISTCLNEANLCFHSASSAARILLLFSALDHYWIYITVSSPSNANEKKKLKKFKYQRVSCNSSERKWFAAENFKPCVFSIYVIFLSKTRHAIKCHSAKLRQHANGCYWRSRHWFSSQRWHLWFSFAVKTIPFNCLCCSISGLDFCVIHNGFSLWAICILLSRKLHFLPFFFIFCRTLISS